jgi:hypothetical protein
MDRGILPGMADKGKKNPRARPEIRYIGLTVVLKLLDLSYTKTGRAGPGPPSIPMELHSDAEMERK